jgi:dipeptidyl aminopeptidase/acylaminoacyl peptidase
VVRSQGGSMKHFTLFYLFLLFSIGTIQAKPLPVSYFAKDANYNGIKISPDGTYFAASVPDGDRTALIIINRKSMQVSFAYYFAENEHVDEYYWANNERVIFTKILKEPWREVPYTDGQIYAGNADGSKRAIVFGYQAGKRTGSAYTNRTGPQRAIGKVVNLLPDDPEHIMITARPFGNSYDASVEIVKVNIYSGRNKRLVRTPFGNMQVVFGATGNPIIASGLDRDGNERKYFYKGRNWEELKEDHPIKDFNPVMVNKSEDILYLSSYPEGKTRALYRYNLLSHSIEKIFQHPEVDFHAYIRNPNDNSIVGVELMTEKINYHYVEPDDAFAKLHKSLAGAFRGHDISITSQTKDQSEMVIFAMSDRNPGDYFLFNQNTKRANELFRSKSWIIPEQMAKKKPIKFNARDGELISGYLTLPNEAKKEYPLVTLVHGGPYGVQDSWWYDSEPQMLANNGYAVLQVNYRGSGGYGKNFEEVAYRKRSTLIQHDIIDGTKWALSLPQIAPNKACIMGWSFGGYSALMSPIIEPDLFKCSIAAAGVYDAVEQEEEADYSRIDSVSARAEEVYGNDLSLLKKESPINYIDRLKIPIFIVHGGKDERVPPEQAYILKEALEEREMAYEWMFKEKEGHGFYNEKNVEEFYIKTLEFLGKYLK